MLIVLITSLCIILKPETKKTPSGITVVSSKTKENEEITEEEAKELAIKQFKKIGEKNLEKDKINIIKVNVDNSMDIAEQYNISNIPALVLLKKGQEVQRLIGFSPKQVIKENIEKHL